MREMKDSGIEWIGEIPATWECLHLKYLCTFKTGGTPNGKKGIDFEGDYPWITPQDIQESFDIEKYTQYISKESLRSSNFVLFPRGTVLLVCIASVGKVGIINTLAYANQQITALKANDAVLPRFLGYVVSAGSTQMAFDASSNVIPIINTKYLQNFSVACPPLSEQKNIVTFLDSKCSEIDAISADIQKEIETLEQYKRSVITEAVTKGLNPDAEMKDSSVEWVGIIPASWISSRLGYETYIRARLGWKGLKADEYVDEGYAFISAFNIQNNKLVWTPLNYITKERYDESPEIKLHIGDVIIVKDGAGIGKCARIDSLPMGETAPNSSIGVITPLAKLNYRYLAYYLQSAIFNNLILKLLNGMGVPHLTQEVLNKTPILLPPKQEQVRIANFLDSKCCEIDSAIETKKKQIDILDAYKKSLIYEYVTGKKEVPNEQ